MAAEGVVFALRHDAITADLITSPISPLLENPSLRARSQVRKV